MTLRLRYCTALILFAAALVFSLSTPACAVATGGEGEAVRVWFAPLTPRPGEPMRILAVAVDGELTGLRLTGPDGAGEALPTVRAGGPPWSLRAVVPVAVAGGYRIEVLRAGAVVARAEIAVGEESAKRGSGRWDLASEALYAAWIEHLFDAPPEESLSFPSLEPVLRDPARNFLYDYLRPGEDARISAEPDCADLPYFLRAYFAWKLGLPLAYRPCDRGTAQRPPQCGPPRLDTSFVGTRAAAEAFRKTSRDLVNVVHSGNARTALDAEACDFYPVPLTREYLWPGTLFADPYGHILILTKWFPQTDTSPGVLLAVDAQPDNSVARKRYWEGNFLFAATPSAGPGFKAYRAPGRSGKSWRQPANAALDGRSGLPPFSTEQADMAPGDFYARMEGLINPQGLNPEAAYRSTLDALMEQLETRVRSVDNGENYMRAERGRVVAMPKGPAIFETVGPWEDYATPSRDMRLLIAMKVLAGLPERIRRHPELFKLGDRDAEEAAAGIEGLHARTAEERFISYTRSDGGTWRLSLAEIYRRQAALEIAYNPNDCVERRWGASLDAEDFATCKRRAPADQIARMEQYRPWFHETRRPPR
ncbi:hypothetical protein [Trichloromonas acetexigens]|uniref:Uncharacterized protein n=1 Tax=Trichloromonas acetexigens TaxID=38815 RepID=A0A550J7Y4_9BACT|nr:hypothetical protein [Desulfuromonas acetexigens]TRO79331.1 hypothetical protein FL622_13765 [Desulfuromonas acetexigens]